LIGKMGQDETTENEGNSKVGVLLCVNLSDLQANDIGNSWSTSLLDYYEKKDKW